MLRYNLISQSCVSPFYVPVYCDVLLFKNARVKTRSRFISSIPVGGVVADVIFVAAVLILLRDWITLHTHVAYDGSSLCRGPPHARSLALAHVSVCLCVTLFHARRSNYNFATDKGITLTARLMAVALSWSFQMLYYTLRLEQFTFC